MRDFRCCAGCLNWENGRCVVTGGKVRDYDCCPEFDAEERRGPIRERRTKKKRRFQ